LACFYLSDHKSIQQLERDRAAHARLQSQPALFDEVIPEE